MLHEVAFFKLFSVLTEHNVGDIFLNSKLKYVENKVLKSDFLHFRFSMVFDKTSTECPQCIMYLEIQSNEAMKESKLTRHNLGIQRHPRRAQSSSKERRLM